MFDYHNDKIGAECLQLASNCKSDMKFGAVLVKDGQVIGRGWNKLSTTEERKMLSHIDYATHAEQGCIIDALRNGFDITGSAVYVLGYAKKSGNLSAREGKYFTCRKCPHSLMRFNIPVFIPHVENGWVMLTGAEALQSAKEHKGYWQNFVKKV